MVKSRTHAWLKDDVWKTIPKDGSWIANAKIRGKLEGEGHSPNAINNCLKSLVQGLQVERKVDESSGRPQIYYRRRTKLPGSEVSIERWVESSITLLRIGLVDALAKIAEDPDRDVNASADLTTFPGIFPDAPRNMLTDFQRMARTWSRVKQLGSKNSLLEMAYNARKSLNLA